MNAYDRHLTLSVFDQIIGVLRGRRDCKTAYNLVVEARMRVDLRPIDPSQLNLWIPKPERTIAKVFNQKGTSPWTSYACAVVCVAAVVGALSFFVADIAAKSLSTAIEQTPRTITGSAPASEYFPPEEQ